MTPLLAPPFRMIFDAIPSPALVIDPELRIRDANGAAAALVDSGAAEG